MSDEKQVEVPIVSAESIGAKMLKGVDDPSHHAHAQYLRTQALLRQHVPEARPTKVREAGVEDLFAELVDRGVTPEEAAEGLRRVLDAELALSAEVIASLEQSADGDV